MCGINYFLFFIALFFLSSGLMYSQNVEDMSRKELRAALTKCYSLRDSMDLVNRKLISEKENLEQKIINIEAELYNTKSNLANSNSKLDAVNSSMQLKDMFIKVAEDSLVNLKNQLFSCKKSLSAGDAELSRLRDSLSEIKRRFAVEKSRMKQNDATLNSLRDSINLLQSEVYNNSYPYSSSSMPDYQTQSLLDSINVLNSELAFARSTNSSGNKKTSNASDFLNSYFFKKEPLNNHTFKFSLDKVIIGNSDQNYSYDYNYRYNYSYSMDFNILGSGNSYNDKNYQYFLPEILSANELSIYKAKVGVKLSSISKAQDALSFSSVAGFNSAMPKLEILKNKLVTMYYSDGTEENFLFNLTTGSENNARTTLQINLASEEVKSDGSKNEEKDVVWKIFVIDNECYLALSIGHLNRIKVNPMKIEDGLVVKDNNNNIRTSNYFNQNAYNDYTTTGQGYYFARLKDSYMSQASYINPNGLIFLFKLIKQ